MHLRCTYEGPERFDRLSIGKVARWGQIRPQDALSLPPRQALDEAGADGVDDSREHDGNDAGRLLKRRYGRRTSG